MFAINTNNTRTLNIAGEEGTAGGTAEGTKIVLTRAEKLGKQIEVLTKRIEADTAKLAEVTLELETAERLSSVGVGTLITARIGRAETSREVQAEVLGVKDEESGARRYKISFGDGFDADVQVIQPSQIVAVTGQVS